MATHHKPRGPQPIPSEQDVLRRMPKSHKFGVELNKSVEPLAKPEPKKKPAK